MSNELGIVGRLLDGVGRMTGRAFRLVGPDTAPLDTSHTVPVTTAEGPRLLVSSPLADRSLQEPPDDDVLHLLHCARQLIEAHEASSQESALLTEELNQSYEDLHLFSRIATQIRSLRFSEEMLRNLLQETRDAMRVDFAAARFIERTEPNVCVVDRSVGKKVGDIEAFISTLLTEIPRSAPEFDRGCYIVNCSSEIPAFAAMHAEPFRVLAVGLRSEKEQYGWLVLVSFDMSEIFRRGEYRLLGTMAEQLELVLANTALYRDLELFVINLVKTLVMAIEAKDEYTRGHSERVSALSRAIGQALGLDSKERSDLQWASVLHDLGKIGTPESILRKRGRLSAAEYHNIQEHPGQGADILEPIAQLTVALPAIRHHHERFDGTGYPDGLQGEAIPLLARVIAVADTYDAITSSRAYRAARSHAEAITIMRECAGTQLDPHLVDLFMQLEESGVIAGVLKDVADEGGSAVAQTGHREEADE